MQQDTKTISEGSTQITLSSNVFYNKIQEYNRDLTIAVITVWSQVYRGNNPLLPKENQIDKSLIEQPCDTPAKQYPKGNAAKKAEKMQKLVAHLSTFRDASTIHSDIKPFTIMEALAATGLRSIRFAKEIPNVAKIIANDLSKDAVESITKNAIFNNVADKVSGNHGDAMKVLYGAVIAGTKYFVHDCRFDVIDLDPYGSATQFIDGAVQAVANNGLLCVTCTDLAVLAGNQPASCFAKYGATNVPNSQYTHELALRILISSIQNSASKYKCAIEVLASFSIDYYIRIFIRVFDSAATIKRNASKTSMVSHCTSCRSFKTQTLGKYSECIKENSKNMSVKIGLATLKLNGSCECCLGPTQIGGPFYGDNIHSKPFLRKLLAHLSESSVNRYGTFERMCGMVSMMHEELDDFPFYFLFPQLCTVMKCPTTTLQIITSAILNAGYKCSLSHCAAASIKTDAHPRIVWRIIKAFMVKYQASLSAELVADTDIKAKFGEGTPGYRILKSLEDEDAKNAEAGIPQPLFNFEFNEGSVPNSIKYGMIRFQMNPEPNWGPQSKARKIAEDRTTLESSKHDQGVEKKIKLGT